MSDALASRLQQAIALHTNGRIHEADAIYRQILDAAPHHAEALHLHGVVCHQLGLHTQAIGLIQRALAQQPTNPAFLNNLGEALRADRQFPLAVACYRQVLARDANDGNALNNLGIALHHLHEFAESERQFLQALTVMPGDPEVLMNFGNMLRDRGDREQAVRRYQQAITNAPQFAPAHAWLGVTLYELGHIEPALAAMEQAVELDPLNEEVHANLKRMRWNLGQHDQLHASYQRACALLPNVAQAHMNFAQSLIRNDQPREAVAPAKHAVSLSSDCPRAHSLLGQAYLGCGQLSASLDAHARAHTLSATEPLLDEEYATALIIAGQHQEACRVLKSAHTLSPRRSGILGRLCVAMREVDDGALQSLVDYDAYVLGETIATPPGFESLAEFNQALHEELKAGHSTDVHALEQTMRGGTQTQNNLFQNPTGLVALLKHEIEAVINRYIAALPDDRNNIFLRFKPERYVFTGAWSTILSQNGFDGSHIHNEGWLSGTYYVVVPELTPEQHAEREGYIQFGEPPRMFCSERNTSVRSIAPEVGKAVLFPSYYWHGVRAFHGGGIRHAVSFDLL